MKPFYFLSLIGLSSLAMGANAENVLTAQDLNITAGGTKTIEICLDNTDNMAGVGFELMLPNGVSYVEDSYDTTGRTFISSKKYFDIVPSDEGSCVRFAIYTTKSIEIEAGTGAIMTVDLTSTIDYNGKIFINSASGSDGSNPISIKFAIGEIGKGGYSTYSSSEDVEIEGATAYYGVVDGSTLKLTEVTDAVMHEKGVVLKGTEGTVVYGTSVDSATEPAENSLQASLLGKDVANVHVLATKDGVTGFYKYTGTKIGAGKAYLEGVTLSRVLFDEETGIDNVEMQNIEAIFNLQGQKLNETKKGINIVNGKKVMF